MPGMFDSVDHVVEALAAERFRATRATATAVYLAAKVGNPLFVQGPHGVGKTSLCKAIANAAGASLVQLQTGSVGPGGDDTNPMLIFLDDVSPADGGLLQLARELVTEEASGSEAQRPWVVLTAASADGLLAPLWERCRPVLLGYPEFECEVSIVMERVPGLSRGLAGQLCNVAGRLRGGAFERSPGVGESISWARALVGLRCSRIDAEMLDQSAARLFSLAEDVHRFRATDLATLVTPGLSCAA